jgi:putative ABC transport system substrate-binding protein
MTIDRRRFISALSGSAFALPLGARAQQPEAVRQIGWLSVTPENDPVGQARLAAFLRAFEDLGWKDGRNVRIEYRWAGPDRARAKAYALELAGLGLDVILAEGSPVVAALKQATTKTPIVFAIVADPVAQGIVSSLAHPGENITGFSFIDYSVVGKAVGLLKTMAPDVKRVGFMFNPESYPFYESYLRSFQADASTLAVEVIAARVRSDAEIGEAIAGLAQNAGGGLVMPPDPYTTSHRETIVKLALQSRLPATSGFRAFVLAGGLMCYGPDDVDIVRRSAAYVDRILKGEKPGDLPVQAPTKFQFVINIKTAKALGLTVPTSLLATADEVIE